MSKTAVAMCVVLFGVAVPVHAQTPAFEYGGWMPYWHTEAGIADVTPRLSQLRTLHPFVYSVTAEGRVHAETNMDSAAMQAFLAEARAAEVRIIPTIFWGDGEAQHRILSDTVRRIALEDEITALVKEKGYDGIDIDFEGKLAETRDYFSTFLKGLYWRMGPKWVYCTIEPRTPIASRYGNTTPPAGAGVYANDYVEINKYCDRVQIMAYDQGGADALLNRARAAPYIPLADAAWAEKVVLEAAKTIPKHKIILGVPTYGYEYTVTQGLGGYRYERLWAFNPRYAVDLAAKVGSVPFRTSSGEVAVIYKPASTAAVRLDVEPSAVSTAFGPAVTLYSAAAVAARVEPPFNLMWWSDAKAVADKVSLSKKLGIRGVAVFKFDGGQDSGIWGVLK